MTTYLDDYLPSSTGTAGAPALSLSKLGVQIETLVVVTTSVTTGVPSCCPPSSDTEALAAVVLVVVALGATVTVS